MANLQLFSNNVTAYLNTAASPASTTITVQSGQGSLFPSPSGGDWFLVTLYGGGTNIEVVKCTSRTGDTLTVTRAQENTIASSFTAGATVEMTATAGTFTRFLQPSTATNNVPLSDGVGTSISWTPLKTVNGNSVIGSGDITITSPGSGGTQITGNVTLTNSSPAAMSVIPTGPGLYATGPDATTCTKNIIVFSIYNAGDYDYGFKNNSGTVIGWVKPRTGATFGLADNSTAAGVWTSDNVSKIGVTAKYEYPNTANMSSSTFYRTAIDADRDLILIRGTDLYAVIDSKADGQGTPTLVKASVTTAASAQAIGTSSTQALVVYNTSSTVLEAVTLTLPASGNTITSVNTGTKATNTPGGTFSGFSTNMVAVGSTYCYGYLISTPVGQAIGITVSGTTPTFGASVSLNASTTTAPVLFASGSVLRTIATGSNTVYSKPFSVSGATLSAGTEANSAFGGTVGAQTFTKTFANGNGNIVTMVAGLSAIVGIVSKLTSTTEALTQSGTTATTCASATLFDVYPVSTSKTLFTWVGSSQMNANILTDTTGTASIGTSYTNGAGTPTAIAVVGASGNTVEVATSLSTAAWQFGLDCSGASPTLSTLRVMNGNNMQVPLSGSDVMGLRDPSVLYTGLTGFNLAYTSAYGVAYRQNDLVAIQTPTMPRTSSAGVPGRSSAESYIGGTTNTGFTFFKVEVAA